jgi:hypothetical protein
MWAFNSIGFFLQFQKEAIEKEEITATTLGNFIKAIKLYCVKCLISLYHDGKKH